MLHDLQNFYLNQEEPIKSSFFVLRELVLQLSENITEHWKYKVPFFYYNGKPFCYLWFDKKKNEPYIGVVKGIHICHPLLEQGNRKKMKIIRVDPCQDIPGEKIKAVLREAILLY